MGGTREPGAAETVATLPASRQHDTPALEELGHEGLRVSLEQPGHYSVRGEYGRGGQSRVLLAVDEFIGREVALKELLALDDKVVGELDSTPRHSLHAAARFLREARITGQLEHPNIVPVYELGRRADGSYFYTQKLVRGATLRRRLSECRNITDRLKLLPHFAGICNAVAYAHSRGVIHRDLKPENVMVGEFGETVVLDWGLAKARGGQDLRADEIARASLALREKTPPPVRAPGIHQTVEGAAMGTPSYMSPEQALGQVEKIDERSDCFSLGAMLYELLSSHPPYDGQNPFEVIGKVIREEVPPLARAAPESLAVAPELVAVAERALQRDPGRRYQTVRELALEVESYLAGGRVRAYRYSSWELVKGFMARNRAAALVTAAALLLVIAGGIALATALGRAEKYLRESRTHLTTAHQNLAGALLERARAAERDEDWPRAAALFAAARTEDDTDDARWGLLLARPRVPAQLLRKPLPARIAVCGFLPDGRAVVAGPGGLLELETGRSLAATSDASELSTARADVATFQPEPARNAAAAMAALLHPFLQPRLKYWPAFSPDGARAAAWVGEGSVEPFSPVDFTRPIALFAGGRKLLSVERAREAQWPALALSADGKLVAAGDGEGSLLVWDAATGKELHALPGLLAPVVFSPDGTRIAAASAGGVVVVADVATGQHLLEGAGHDRALSSLAFSRDGSLLASGSANHSVRVWDAAAGAPLARLEAPAAVDAVAFSPDGARLLVMAGGGALAQLWGLPQQLRDLRVQPERRVAHAAFSPDGARLATADSELALWDGASGRLVTRIDAAGPPQALHYSPDGALLASIESNAIQLRDAQSGAALGKLAPASGALAFSGDGALVASSLSVWDVQKRSQLWKFESPSGAVALSPDGKSLAARRERQVSLFDARTGARTGSIDAVALALAFTPDGRALAAGAADSLSLWDLAARKPLWRNAGPAAMTRELAFSRDGKTLATAGFDRAVHLWDAQTGRELARLPRHGSVAGALAVAPDLHAIASAGAAERGLRLLWPGDPRTLRPPADELAEALSRAHAELKGIDLVESEPPAPTAPAEQQPDAVQRWLHTGDEKIEE